MNKGKVRKRKIAKKTKKQMVKAMVNSVQALMVKHIMFRPPFPQIEDIIQITPIEQIDQIEK